MNGFTGTGQLLRLALRRDRILLPVWVLVFAASAAGSASATVELYPTVESRVQAAEAANSAAALVALYGPILDPTSLGALSMLKLSVLGSALVAVLMILVMVRHTRAEEEAGRLELIGATAIGRYAPLSAALIVCWGTSVVLGLVTAAGLVAVGLPAAGSLAFGLAWSAAGVIFSSVAAVAAQLARTSRAAVGLSVLVLGVSYLIRAISDVSTAGGLAWLSWLSPLGLGQQVRAYAGDRFWVLLVLVMLATALTYIALALNRARDLSAGLLTDRGGPAHASPALRGPFGLAWRLQRGPWLAWLAGFVVLGLVLGNIVTSVTSMVDSESARELFAKLGGTQVLTDAYIATAMSFMGFIAAAFGIQAAMKLRSEEVLGHTEVILASAVTRHRWAMSHLALALVGVAALVIAGGLAAGVSAAAAQGDSEQLGRMVIAAAVQIPAAWTLVGLVALLFGLLPRFIWIGWAVLVGLMLLAELGPLLQIDPVFLNASPFANVPRFPASEVAAMPLVTLAAVAGALCLAGIALFRMRDID